MALIKVLTNSDFNHDMRTCEAEAKRAPDYLPSRWGYVRASTEAEALAVCKKTSGLPYNSVHQEPVEMIWPGIAGENWFLALGSHRDAL